MPAAKGRQFQIVLTSVSPNTAIAGCQTKSVSWAGEPIDITSDDDSGYRTLLDGAGTESLDISFDGVTKDTTMRTRGFNSGGTTQYSDFKIVFPNGDSITGTFNLTSYEENGTHNDAVKFSATLQSSGQWTATIS
ncbi:MAG: hypothetical protein D6711_14235 [Chloroflexi bacterium]|nr:MAG: hypothetical protein D6711_14235 [Chloroflexota bacterium]